MKTALCVLYRFGSEQVDVAQLHALLSDTYWANDRPLAQVATAVRNSFCISAWGEDRMVGFARLMTDFATQAYLADVIIARDQRGRGIGTNLVRKLISHEAVATCRLTLHTRDAHDVYRPLGFTDFPSMVKPRRREWSPIATQET